MYIGAERVGAAFPGTKDIMADGWVPRVFLHHGYRGSPARWVSWLGDVGAAFVGTRGIVADGWAPLFRHDGFRGARARWISWRAGTMDWVGCPDEASVWNGWVRVMYWKPGDGGLETIR